MKSATPDGLVRERHNRAAQGTQLVQVDGPRSAASEDSPARRDGPKRRVFNALANATRQGRTDRGATYLQKLERTHHGPSRIARRIPHETSDTKGGPRCPPTLPHRSYIPLVHGRSLWKELLGPGKD